MVINLFSGPGCGKSTTAAGVFSLLKLHGFNCELVTEFAKDLTWEESWITLSNQNYVTAMQHHRLHRLKSNVDVIVTDSPLLLGICYCKDIIMNKHIRKLYNEFDNANYLLSRVKPYQEVGRSQSEEEAISIDNIVKDILKDEVVSKITGDYEGINHIVRDFLEINNMKLKYSIRGEQYE